MIEAIIVILLVAIPIWRIMTGIEKDIREKQKKGYVFIEDFEEDWEKEDDELTEESYDLTGDLM